MTIEQATRLKETFKFDIYVWKVEVLFRCEGSREELRDEIVVVGSGSWVEAGSLAIKLVSRRYADVRSAHPCRIDKLAMVDVMDPDITPQPPSGRVEGSEEAKDGQRGPDG